MSNWKQKAIEIAENNPDRSWRSIARELGVAKSTLSDFMRGQIKGYVRPSETIMGVVKRTRGNFKVVKNKYGEKHLIIADTQVKPSSDMGYLIALGRYIADKRPDVIIHIGDNYDFESLSSYDKGKRSFEGRRVRADIDAGNEGMSAIVDQFKDIEGYNPRMVFCCGNHEQRVDRFTEDNPEFMGFLGTDLLNLEQFGWEVHPFLKPVEISGINYVHYLANPFTGKPYGGSALNQLKNVGNSFVVGHKQCLDIAIRPTLDGRMQIGIINGAYYPHFEDYKGYTGNNHFRGITVLHDVKDGFGEPMMVSLNYLMDKYGGSL